MQVTLPGSSKERNGRPMQPWQPSATSIKRTTVFRRASIVIHPHPRIGLSQKQFSYTTGYQYPLHFPPVSAHLGSHAPVILLPWPSPIPRGMLFLQTGCGLSPDKAFRWPKRICLLSVVPCLRPALDAGFFFSGYACIKSWISLDGDGGLSQCDAEPPLTGKQTR